MLGIILDVWWRLIGSRQAARRQREAMLALDDHLLEDIGLTRADLGAERSKWEMTQWSRVPERHL
jgi:uncharacterized protein YjiS (DUF1127 family)